MNKQIRYRIEGLDCAEEVALLRKALEGQPGIDTLQFDIIQSRMTVTYDPRAAHPESIVQAVRAAGMRALPWQAAGNSTQDSGFWARHGRLIMTASSGLLLLTGFLTHWILRASLIEALLAHEAEHHARIPLAVAIFYVGAIITGVWYVALKAVLSVRRLRPDMNLLMTIAIIGALGIGQWFEGATVAFLFALALLLEQWSVGHARRAINALLDMTPRTAHVLDGGDRIEERDVDSIHIGAVVLVKPGEKIPLDGVVLSGSSAVNQAPITGESEPVEKNPGDEVFAGTINEEGSLEFRVTHRANDTALARIIHLVEEAQAHRAPSQRWVDRFAEVYTPIIIVIAAAVMVIPPLAMGGQWVEWLYRGLVMLVIACPCALVISTPVTIVAGLAAAARNGVLIKGGRFLEVAGSLRAVCLDKTGTLTHGQPAVRQILPFDNHTPHRLLEHAAALEVHSEHPVARAIIRRAEAEGVTIRRAIRFQAVRGKGAEGEIGSRRFWIGNYRFLQERGLDSEAIRLRVEALEDSGHSVVILGNSDHVCGVLTVADTPRTEARETIDALHRLGVRKVIMLTGDNAGTARAVAKTTGVDEFRAELLPEDKADAVRQLVHQYGRVAMVGDGINDAPALVSSSLGIAMAAIGTDAAIETADVALMSDELHKIPWFILHSRRTFRIVKQNIAFALGLKALFMILALLGMATLWMAVVADTGASLLVVFNGLRLLRGWVIPTMR